MYHYKFRQNFRQETSLTNL